MLPVTWVGMLPLEPVVRLCDNTTAANRRPDDLRTVRCRRLDSRKPNINRQPTAMAERRDTQQLKHCWCPLTLWVVLTLLLALLGLRGCPSGPDPSNDTNPQARDGQVAEQTLRRDGGSEQEELAAAQRKAEREAIPPELRDLDWRLEVDLTAPGKPVTAIRIMDGLNGPVEAKLEHLAGLTQLRRLYIGVRSVGDADLIHLREVPQLRELELERVSVTDAGLAHLAAVPHLQSLTLSYVGIGDAGLAHLEELTELRNLTLKFARKSPARVGTPSSLGQVEQLALTYRTSVTDAGFVHLAAFPPTPTTGPCDGNHDRRTWAGEPR